MRAGSSRRLTTHVIPGYDVFRQVLRRIDLDALAQGLTQWLQAHTGELPRTLAMDGKIIRDHLGLIVALVDAAEGTPVALAAHVKGKGHELKTTQALLAPAEGDGVPRSSRPRQQFRGARTPAESRRRKRRV